jgi:hypothetical protein
MHLVALYYSPLLLASIIAFKCSFHPFTLRKLDA